MIDSRHAITSTTAPPPKKSKSTADADDDADGINSNRGESRRIKGEGRKQRKGTITMSAPTPTTTPTTTTTTAVTINGLDILKGVSICLTGLTAPQKMKLHDLVEFLGGRFTRDLLTRKTTHLIANKYDIERAVGGEKIREALKHKRRIEILTPEWLEACKIKKRRVSECDYRLFPLSDDKDDDIPNDGGDDGEDDDTNNGAVLVGLNSHKDDLEGACDELLVPGEVPLNPLFSACFFFLVGFCEDIPNDGKGDGDFTTHQHDTNGMAIKQKCLRLVRRCMGTVVWDLNESITHVIVKDGCDPKLRNGVYKFCRRHSNCPTAISPQWIIASMQNRRLVRATSYPPTTTEETTTPTAATATTTATPHTATGTTQQQRRKRPKLTISSSLVPTRSQSLKTILSNKEQIVNNNTDTNAKTISTINGSVNGGIFEGLIFHIFHRTTPTIPPPIASEASGMISFDADELEGAIISHGGQKLCQRVVDTLLSNRRGKRVVDDKMDHVCYIVTLPGEMDNGNADDDSSTDNVDLLNITYPSSQALSALVFKLRHLCKIVSVTPIWVQTCLEQKRVTPPEQYSSLFQPHPWALKKISPTKLVGGDTPSGRGRAGDIKVAVTGFQGAERIGISHLLIAMGVTYTEAMGKDNTHLIVKDAVGPKFTKAVEWGLYVVTVEWLFHVARFGYDGDTCIDEKQGALPKSSPTRTGCEGKFAPVAVRGGGKR